MKNFFKKCAATIKNDRFVGQVFDLGHEEIETINQIAEGSFAYIYETSSPSYVIKHMRIETEQELRDVFQEVAFEASVSYHKNINKLAAVFINQTRLPLTATFEEHRRTSLPCDFNMVLERCETSVLAILNKTKDFLPEKAVLQLFAGVVAGFTVQHNKGITNRDGKIENMLIRSMNHEEPLDYRNIRICDFGSCTRHEYADGAEFIRNPTLRAELEAEISAKTTPEYRAPELIDLFSRLPVTRKSDVFALGVILYRLMYKQLPFPEGEILANFNIRYQFPDETEEYLKRSKYHDRSDVPIYSSFLKDLVRACLVKDPAERASVFQLAAMIREKIGDFGAEEEVPLAEEPTSSVADAPVAESKPQATDAGVGLQNMFEWVPVQPSVQQPAQLPAKEDIPHAGPANQDSLFEWAPTGAAPQAERPASVPPSAGEAKPNLFDWGDFNAVQPVQGNTTEPPQQQDPVGDLLDFGGTSVQPQAQDTLVEPVHSVPSPTSRSGYITPTSQELSSRPPLVVQQVSIEMQHISPNMSDNAQIGIDDLMTNTRKVACAIFTTSTFNIDKIKERYVSMLVEVKECLLNQYDPEIIQQLSTNFEMLITQNKNATNNPNREEITAILKDLCTLQEISIEFCRMHVDCTFENGVFQLCAQEFAKYSSTVLTLLNLVNGLNILNANSQFLKLYEKLIAEVIVKPVLRTVKVVCGYEFGLNAQQLAPIKAEYARLGGQSVFGVAVSAVIELGSFE